VRKVSPAETRMSSIVATRPAVDFERLLLDHQAALLRLARRLVHDGEEARDLVQAAFADAYERRGRLNDPAAAPAWLRSVLVSRAVSHLRRKRLKTRIAALFGAGLDLGEPPCLLTLPDAQIDAARVRRELQSAIDCLAPRQAVALALRYGEGLSVDEVAAAMNVGRGTVRTHLHRALETLRTRLPGGGER